MMLMSVALTIRAPFYLFHLAGDEVMIQTMPRPNGPSSAVMNSSTFSRLQISGGSSRMTLRLYSVKATSTP